VQRDSFLFHCSPIPKTGELLGGHDSRRNYGKGGGY